MRVVLGDQPFDVTNRVLVMGILNRTRDSFYDGGAYYRLDDLLERADELVRDGADLLDVGARPGGVGVREVSESEETDLACATLDALRHRFDIPLSIDTRRAAVAAEAYRTGALLGNDMSGFADPAYLPAAAAAGASVIATHIRLPPGWSAYTTSEACGTPSTWRPPWTPSGAEGRARGRPAHGLRKAWAGAPVGRGTETFEALTKIGRWGRAPAGCS